MERYMDQTVCRSYKKPHFTYLFKVQVFCIQ